MNKEIKLRIIAIAISIVVLILSFLILFNLFFIEDIEVDTYVSYTTATGECYHAKGCQYLRNSSYKTTVYEAEQDGYRSCSKCNPCRSIYATTYEYQKRNYVAPAIISVVIAGSTFGGIYGIGILILKKEEQVL